MVYESDFYTTRRYRTSPSVTSYTISGPSRQVRVLPGLGKRTYYHVSYPTSYYGFYDSINLPSSPFLPKTYRWYYSWPRQYSSYWPYYYPSFSYYWPSYRPYLSSYLRNLYFNDYWPYSTYWSTYWPYYRSLDYEFSDLEDKIRNLRIFDDETRLIRAQTASLLRRIHDPVPRVKYTWPCPCPAKYVDNGLPARLTNDYYINKMLTSSSINPNVSYTTYYTEPIRRYIGSGHLSCTAYSGGMPYSRRSHLFLYEDPMRNDIQLLSFYINKFKQEKAMRGEAPAIESSKVKKSEQRSAKVEKHESIDKSETTDEKPVITEVSE